MGHLLFLDFETYYDAEYSLKRMTPAEYILSPKFEMIICAVKADGGPHEIIDGPDFPKWLAQFDPAITTTVTFNSLFDNAILAWRYGFVPNTMLDAMGMARALDGHKLVKFSLAALSEYLGIDAKGDTIHNVIGMRRSQIMADPALWSSYKNYAIRDNKNCESIFLHYYPRLPPAERRLMDMVLRCCVEPRFHVNTKLLDDHISEVVLAKEQLLTNANNVDKMTVMSTSKFKAALEALGVDIEYKTTPAGNEAPAFAKSDAFMETLQNHADPAVAALAVARVGLKSTLEETRAKTLLRIGNLPWHSVPSQGVAIPTQAPEFGVAAFALAREFGTERDLALASVGLARMPIPLRYGGAHTHRLSGDWKMNMQNMPTVRGSKGKSKLRLSLEAPPGCSVVTCDLGQIEARLVAWICKATRLMQEFAQKLDPYNQLASDIFGRPVNRKLAGTLDEIMGFIGKTGILGLGYGCGKDKFDSMVIAGARAQDVDISQIYTRAIGDTTVDRYRKRYVEIPTSWRRLSSYIETFWFQPGPGKVQFGPVEISYGRVLLPNGLTMEYDEPRQKWIPDTTGSGASGRYEYSYRYGKLRHRLYGAKLLENIVQALARIIVMNAALRIRDRGRHTKYPWAYRFCHQAHDELVFIVPNEILDEAKKIIHSEMVRPPSWGRDIPLVADINHGNSYGEAK